MDGDTEFIIELTPGLMMLLNQRLAHENERLKAEIERLQAELEAAKHKIEYYDRMHAPAYDDVEELYEEE